MATSGLEELRGETKSRTSWTARLRQELDRMRGDMDVVRTRVGSDDAHLAGTARSLDLAAAALVAYEGRRVWSRLVMSSKSYRAVLGHLHAASEQLVWLRSRSELVARAPALAAAVRAHLSADDPRREDYLLFLRTLAASAPTGNDDDPDPGNSPATPEPAPKPGQPTRQPRAGEGEAGTVGRADGDPPPPTATQRRTRGSSTTERAQPGRTRAVSRTTMTPAMWARLDELALDSAVDDQDEDPGRPRNEPSESHQAPS